MARTPLLMALLTACAGTGTLGLEPGTESPTGATPSGAEPAECTEAYGDDLFERYIEPLVRGGQPVTCNQCHLAGLDLSVYVQDTPCQTMACMVDEGVADLSDPGSSLVLSWILRAEPDSNLITDEVIQREHDSFLDWITWSSTCHDAVCGDFEDPCDSGGSSETTSPPIDTGGSPTGGGPLGNCTEVDMGARFEANVYVNRERCAGCHQYGAPYGDGLSPEFIDMGGDWYAGLATMYNIIGAGYLDAADPGSSLLLLKPLAVDLGGVEHGGGTKIDEFGDPTYIGILAFAEYYAGCQNP